MRSENKVSKRSDKKSKKRRTVMWIVILLLAIIGACVAIGLIYANKMISKVDYQNTGSVEWEIDSQVATDLADYRNIAILGVDARSMTNYDGSRSDAIIVMSINKKTGSIKLISLMRDSYLEIYDSKGKLKLDKITHAHAFGGGVDTCRSLNRNLDLNIKEYAIFNWKAVADTVDALGGVKVDVKESELHDLNKYGNETGRIIGRSYTIVSSAGVQTLDGIQAASYCRIRKTSGGDSQRAERMKKVMGAIFSEAKHMNISQINKIADKALPEIRTNIKNNAILGLISGIVNYKLDGNIGLPYKYKGGMFHGGWYAVPKTLESNVIRLHNEAFGLADYKVTETVLGISKKIEQDTGVTAN
jgi:polyisoprenyl-teichoic acid--peptidoglycan teichoic acid transferase